MGYKINIRDSSTSWDNLLKDSNIEITDDNGYFASSDLKGVLDELYNSSGGSDWSVVTASASASVNNGYLVDTDGGEITLTLPSSATIGDKIEVVDYSGSFGTNNCVIARNGHNIMGLAENFICNIDDMGIEFVYADATQGWRIADLAAGGSSGGSLELSDDTATDTDQYLCMSRETSGAWADAYLASTKLYFNPSTGTLSSTVFQTLSDVNKKKNITDIKDPLSIIENLRGVEFNWKDNGRKSSGVIAQELEMVLPHLVDTNKDGVKSVNYDGIIGYLIECIKDLNDRVK